MLNQESPKPGRLFIATAYAVVSISAIGFAVHLGGAIAVTRNPVVWLINLLLLVFFGWLGWLQLGALTAYSETAAVKVFRSLAYTGGLVLLIAVGVTLSGAFRGSYDDAQLASLAWPLSLLAIGSACLFAAHQNRNWAETLTDNPVQRPRRQFSLRELLTGMYVVCLVIGATTVTIRSIPPEYAVAVGPEDAPIALPNQASDVDFRQFMESGLAVEFTISEPLFRQWVDSRIRPRLQTEIEIQPITSPVQIQSAVEQDVVTIHNGLEFRWRHQEQRVYAYYHRATGRAYYYEHWR